MSDTEIADKLRDIAGSGRVAWGDEIGLLHAAADIVEKHAELKGKLAECEASLPLSTGKTRNHAIDLLGEVLRHRQGLGSHGCVEVANAIRVIDSLIGDRECLAVENSKLRGVIQRARAMIDVSPEDPPNKWPSTDEINQLVKECDDILENAQADL